jgi:hypothetical protein
VHAVREAQSFRFEDQAYYHGEATISSVWRLGHERKRGCVNLIKTLRTAGSIASCAASAKKIQAESGVKACFDSPA